VLHARDPAGDEEEGEDVIGYLTAREAAEALGRGEA